MTLLKDLKTIQDFAEENPNVFRSANAVRWVIGKHRAALERAGAVVRLDKKLFVDREAFTRWLSDRNAR